MMSGYKNDNGTDWSERWPSGQPCQTTFRKAGRAGIAEMVAIW